MFEKFTYEARVAVVGAQEVARARGARQIGTIHLLIALLSPGSAATDAVSDAGAAIETLTAPGEHGELDADALSAVGVDLDRVTARAEEVFGPGALARAGRSPKHLPFDREAKKSLQLALREAIRLQQRSITGRHLLLGLIRAECAARTALVRAGADLAVLRPDLEQPGAQSA
ncbi:MAG TPA: hypothetical protein H9815_20670 [Candidatus Ruania gallistercoris]|uniref:Clp R domain-containing protein n=1 Tax=Candidatus Ruania gallistercoris TaxID=2838746 RepID=A0A9D2J758_9MICO|nr:hypothetical protein [Candidatus Ruania gallistercoris]